jgi:allantoinase
VGATVGGGSVTVELAAPLAARAGARLHVVHVSSAEAVAVARRWPGVTIETCPHYLLLTERAVADPLALCAPPVRSADNRERLWSAVLAGEIDWIASDHSPCPLEMKQGPKPWAGISGVQTTLPLLISSEKIGLSPLVRLLTAAAAHLRLPGKGTLRVGADADLVLLDPVASWPLTTADLLVRHPLSSPFLGWPLTGRVVRTLVRGNTVFTLDGGVRRGRHGRLVRPWRSRGTTRHA